LPGTIDDSHPSEIHGFNPKIPVDAGYSKAIDMWSIGCIAFLLLSGHHAFAFPTDPEYQDNPLGAIMERASKCNIDVIDTSPTWNKVSKRAKGFLKSLLVLDEEKRLTAKQALDHQWFTNPTCAAEYEKIYEHCTRDWRPRRKVFKLVEHLSSPQIQIVHQQESLYFAENKSKARTTGEQESKQRMKTLPPIAEDAERSSPQHSYSSLPILDSHSLADDSQPPEDLIMISDHSHSFGHRPSNEYSEDVRMASDIGDDGEFESAFDNCRESTFGRAHGGNNSLEYL
jgi:serine/threonine protein kinase